MQRSFHRLCYAPDYLLLSLSRASAGVMLLCFRFFFIFLFFFFFFFYFFFFFFFSGPAAGDAGGGERSARFSQHLSIQQLVRITYAYRFSQ
jgi:hypothetical protein